MKALGLLAAGLALFSAAAVAQPAAPAAWVSDIGVYSRDAWDRTETECDRLAAHPDDPERVGAGVPQPEVQIEPALAACHAAAAADPANPRLNYQLARVYGYAGRSAEGQDYRQRAVLAGYPQSLFVVGFILVTGWGGQERDPCTAAELIRLSAIAGRKAGLIGFPHYVVNGAFEGCPVRVDRDEMQGFLTAAEPMAASFYERILIENLRVRLAALP